MVPSSFLHSRGGGHACAVLRPAPARREEPRRYAQWAPRIVLPTVSLDLHEPPHFHARYQDQEIIVEIESGIVTGKMSKRALRLVLDWADQHQGDLAENWRLARARKALQPIPPLE
jgi:hypothetical protein